MTANRRPKRAESVAGAPLRGDARYRYHSGPRRRRVRRVFFRGGRTLAKEVILTKEGYEKLKQEIEFLSTEKRREVAERIRVAREFGDIAENSEYDDAKNEQALVEHRIATDRKSTRLNSSHLGI